MRAVFFVLLLLLSMPVHGGEEEVFSWRQASGQTLRVMLNKHPYADGIKRRLAAFEEMTGIKVAYITYPETKYFEYLDRSFDDPSAKPDVYMTGVYQVWEYAPRGRMLALDRYVVNPVSTRQGYNINDFFPTISGAFRWNRIAGSELGKGPLWAVPMGFESASLIYNREVLARYRIPVPETMEEFVEAGVRLRGFEGEGTYGIAARGVGEWNSLHTGYITSFANYGAKDFAVENGRLVSKVNSPEAVAATDMWVRILRDCGPEDWEFYDWYRCLEDIGGRKAAMLFDADVLGYIANSAGASGQSGRLGLAPPPLPAPSSDEEGEKGRGIQSNLWVWGLAINPESASKDAAWLFVQYFTGREFQTYSVLEWRSVNPPRRSIFEDERFRKMLATMHGYEETFEAVIQTTRVHFTPTPYFFDIAKRWASVVRDIANGMYSSTQEGLDTLKIWMDSKVAKVPVE